MDQMACDRVVVVGRKVQPEPLVDVLKTGVSVHDILSVAELSNLILFIGVVLVADFADDFLEKILKRDDSGRRAVLVENDRNRNRLFSEFCQQVGGFLKLKCEERFPHGGCNREILLIAPVPEEIL